MAESQDVNTLRRRGRRRLVGAIALVLLAAIILPMVFDPEPKPSAPPVSVRIPGEDETSFAPKVTPKVETPPFAASPGPAPATGYLEPPKQPAQSLEKPAPAASLPEATPTPRKSEGNSVARLAPLEAPKPAAKAAETAAPKLAEQAATPQAAPGHAPSTSAAEQFVVPVAALASQSKVKDLLGKLKAARLPYYTESLATAKGSVTRVRVGPYATREAAEGAQRQLKRLGLNPGNVLAKP